MPDTTTAHYNLIKVEVGGSTNTWGGKLNTNADSIDDLIYQARTEAVAGSRLDQRLRAGNGDVADLNDAVDSGWYWTTASASNRPSGLSSGWLQVITRGTSDTSIQVWYSADSDRVFRRFRTALNTWGAWVEISIKEAPSDGKRYVRRNGVWEETDRQIGKIDMFAFSAIPTDYMECDGAAISRVTYAPLFTKIGTIFGAGDGTTTFNIPDMRGEFPRGWDNGRGVDTGRAFGSAQGDLVKNHTHTFSDTTSSAGGHSHTLNINAAGNHNHSVNIGQFDGTTMARGGSSNTGSFNTGTESSHTHTGTTDTEPAHTHTISGTTANNAGGGAENRPRNVALLFCIKYQ